MRILFFVIVFLTSLSCATASIKLTASLEVVDDEIFLNISLKNQGQVELYVPTLNKKLVNLRLDLWCLGKGVELYLKDDAEWRRQQAFANLEWQSLKAGDTKIVVIRLGEMRSADPDNDEFAKKLFEEFAFIKSGRAYVSVMFSSDQKNPSPQKLYAKVKKGSGVE